MDYLVQYQAPMVHANKKKYNNNNREYTQKLKNKTTKNIILCSVAPKRPSVPTKSLTKDLLKRKLNMKS